MSDETDQAYQDIVNYVDAASALAESVASDIKDGREYSSRTVLKLSEFIGAAKAIEYMLDQIEVTRVKLN